METVDLLKQLEIKYKHISNDLEFSSHRLDSQMADAVARTKCGLPDLNKLVTRIQALQAIVPTLLSNVGEVVHQREELQTSLGAVMLDNHNHMIRLYARLGVLPDPEWVISAQEVAKVENGTRQDGHDNDPGRTVDTVGQGYNKDHCDYTVGVERGPSKTALTKPLQSAKSSGIIFEEDFFAVPSTTRGRCKLDDVRKVYDKVREDHREKLASGRPVSKPKPISRKELDAAGLKVFGLTGDGILNTLRALGLVTVTRAGVSLVTSPSSTM